MLDPQMQLLIEEIATKTANKAVQQTLIQLGVDGSRPIEVQEDFHFLRNLRESSEEMKKKGILVAVTTIITALLGLVWLGFKGSL